MAKRGDSSSNSNEEPEFSHELNSTDDPIYEERKEYILKARQTFSYELYPTDDPTYEERKKYILKERIEDYSNDIKGLAERPEVGCSCGLDSVPGEQLEKLLDDLKRFCAHHVNIDATDLEHSRPPMSWKIGFLDFTHEVIFAESASQLEPLKNTLGERPVAECLQWLTLNMQVQILHAKLSLCEAELFRAARNRRQGAVMPLLEAKGWSSSRWAGKAGVSKNSVYEYLDGKRNLSTKNREELAQALGIEPKELPE